MSFTYGYYCVYVDTTVVLVRVLRVRFASSKNSRRYFDDLKKSLRLRLQKTNLNRRKSKNPIFFIEKRGFERLQGIINRKTDGNKSVITEITEESCQV